MTADEVRQVLRAGGRLRMKTGNEPSDPILELRLEDGMVLHESVAGWSWGVVEPVCSIDSSFLSSYIAGREVVVS